MEKKVIEGILGSLFPMLGDWVFPHTKESRKRDRLANNVRRCVDLIVDGFRELGVCIGGGSFYVYNGRYYEYMSDTVLRIVCERLIRELDAIEYITSILPEAMREVKMVAYYNEAGRREFSYLGFQNVVLDLYSWEVKDFGKDLMIFKILPYEYNPSVRSYRWIEFLNAVIPDKGYRRLFQEYVGSLLISRAFSCNDYMLVLHGKSSTGKKTLLRIVEYILGNDNFTHYPLRELVSGGGELPSLLGRIDRKIANIDYEYDGGLTMKSESLLRGLISADPMEAELKSGGRYTARHIPHLIVNAFQLPPVNELSYGVRSQMLIIPFENSLDKERYSTSTLKELLLDSSSIFNWVMEGLQSYMRNGKRFSDEKLIKASMKIYQASRSTVLKFLMERGYRSSATEYLEEVPIWTDPKELYEEYVRWCISEEEPKVKYGAFEKAMCSEGYVFKFYDEDSVVALYGQKAIKRQAGIISMRRAKAEYREMLELKKREGVMVTWSTIERYAQNLFVERGWNRIVVGFDELTEYVGAGQNWVEQMMKGNLEGCYVEDHGVFYFNLDAIDSVWRPVYERGLKRRGAKKREDKKYNEQVKENNDGE